MAVLIKLIAWLHIIAATVSIVCGAIALFSKKGGGVHRTQGRYYYYAMLVNNFTALCVYNAFGKWFFPHTLAIVTLAFLIPGYLIIRTRFRYRIKVHILCSVASYYLLIGGAIQELFLRVDIAKAYAAKNPLLVANTHTLSMLAFLSILIYYLVSYKSRPAVPDTTEAA